MAEYAISHVAPLLYSEPGKKGVIEKQSGPQGLPLFTLRPALAPWRRVKVEASDHKHSVVKQQDSLLGVASVITQMQIDNE